MARTTGYSATQIALHWITAILVIAAWFTSDSVREFMRPGSEATGTPIHVALGLGVLGAVVLRLILRAVRGAPEPAATSGAMRAAAVWGHRLLYVLVIAVPVLGMARWFGDVRAAGDIHGLAANLLLLTAGGHAVLALWHQYGRRDGTLMRMLRPQS